MRIFSYFYQKAMQWSVHRHATRYLAGLSFVESSFFPVPPDIMLAAMAFANPVSAWKLASITTIFSVLGGIFGYVMGLLFFTTLAPYIDQMGYSAAYQQVQYWFNEWGIWIVLIAGFSPIPYKLFTIGAGSMVMPILPFIIASLCGRGARFFLVAGIIYFGGARVRPFLEKYIDYCAWIILIIFCMAYVLYYVLYK